MVAIDLFSGAGGLTEGFLNEEYKFVAHVEKDYWACETLKTRIMYYYLKERNDIKTYFEYLKQLENYEKVEEYRQMVYKKYPKLQEYLNQTVLNKKFGNPNDDDESTDIKTIIKLIKSSMEKEKIKKIDVIIGGPPCQAYSVIGRSRMKEKVKDDNRNYLFYYYRDIVAYFKPKMFIFENVPGIFTAMGGKIFQEIKGEFSKIGYELKTNRDDQEECIKDSSRYGVYQTRKRVILFGYKKELKYEYPDIKKYALKFDENITTENAISDLKSLQPSEGEDYKLIKYNKKSKSEYQAYLRQDSIGIFNHKARTLNKERDRKIYKIAIEKSEKNEKLSYMDLPDKLKTHKNQKSFSDRFKVHGKNEIPHTIVAHICKDGHYNIHPDIKQCRSLTVREAARIQSFPDNFIFEGPRTSQYMQVGNAVPPILSKAIARALKDIK